MLAVNTDNNYERSLEMESITTRITSTCRNRSAEKKKQILEFIDRIPFMDREDEACYKLVSDTFFALDDGSSFFRFKQRGDIPQYVIDVSSVFLKNKLNKNKPVKKSIGKLVMCPISSECDEEGISYINIHGDPGRLEDSAVAALKAFKDESRLLNTDIHESTSRTILRLKKSGCVKLSEAAEKRISATAESTVSRLDVEELSDRLIDYYKQAGLRVPIYNKAKVFGDALCAAAAEYAVLDQVFQGKLSKSVREGREYLSALINRYLSALINRVGTSIISELVGLYDDGIREQLDVCFEYSDDSRFLEYLKDDFSFWTRLSELLVQEEYYTNALKSFKQAGIKARMLEELKNCTENNRLPSPEQVRKLICNVVSNTERMSPDNQKPHKFSAFNSTVNNWFDKYNKELLKGAQVHREHVFIIAFALKLSVDDAERLLMDGAKQEGFDPKCLKEMIYRYCLNWKLSYVDANMMWLRCIEDMLHRESLIFLRRQDGDTELTDEVCTDELMEEYNEYFKHHNDVLTDSAFAYKLAGNFDLEIAELSEWIVWKYLESNTFSDEISGLIKGKLDDKTFSGIIGIIDDMDATLDKGQKRADEAKEKLGKIGVDETKADYREHISIARKVQKHPARTVESAIIRIRKLIEEEYKDPSRVNRYDEAYYLSYTLKKELSEFREGLSAPVLWLGKLHLDEEFEDIRGEGDTVRAFTDNYGIDQDCTIRAIGGALTYYRFTQHLDHALPVTRADVLLYCFWITVADTSIYNGYDPESTFTKFLDLVNDSLERCRFHKFYVRSVLDRILYICFWDEDGPVYAYRRIMKSLRPVEDDKITDAEIKEWENSFREDSDDEHYKKMFGRQRDDVRTGKSYIKAIFWLFNNTSLEQKYFIWERLGDYYDKELGIKRDLQRHGKERLERREALEKIIEEQEKLIESIEKKTERQIEACSDPVEIEGIKKQREDEIQKCLKIKNKALEKLYSIGRSRKRSDALSDSRLYDHDYSKEEDFIIRCKLFFEEHYDEFRAFVETIRPNLTKKLEAMLEDLTEGDQRLF